VNAAFNEVTGRLGGMSSGDRVTIAIHVTVLCAAMLLVIESELIRAAGGLWARRTVRLLSVALPVLLTVSAVILASRIFGAR
jgi:ABC-type sugar transport system permease subunit